MSSSIAQNIEALCQEQGIERDLVIDAMKEAVRQCNPEIANFEASCFDGVYITGDVGVMDAARINAGRAIQDNVQEASRLSLHAA